MLEKMGDFFNARINGYEEHMLTTIDFAQDFYPVTASLLPTNADAHILDLGCGTGLELNDYFRLNPTVHVTGIDLAADMLQALRAKFPAHSLDLRLGSYFDLPFEENHYDAAVSVESLHHFTLEEKIPLYKKLRAALKDGGYFLLTDYFATSDEQETAMRAELLRLKAEQGLSDDEFYHYDTPLTVPHEMQALRAAGFSLVEDAHAWGHTHLLRATK